MDKMELNLKPESHLDARVPHGNKKIANEAEDVVGKKRKDDGNKRPDEVIEADTFFGSDDNVEDEDEDESD